VRARHTIGAKPRTSRVQAMLAVVTLRQEVAGAANAAASVALGQSLVAVRDWTFLLGPGIPPGIGNGLLLGYLRYRSDLVPEGMPCSGWSPAPC
jgi:hypothetical protein